MLIFLVVFGVGALVTLAALMVRSVIRFNRRRFKHGEMQ